MGRRTAALEGKADPQRHRLLGRLLADRPLRACPAALPPGAARRQPLSVGRSRRLTDLGGDHRRAGRHRSRVLARRVAARHVRRGQVRLALLVGRQAVGPRPDRDRGRPVAPCRTQRRAGGTAGSPLRSAGDRAHLHRAAAEWRGVRVGRSGRDAAADLPADRHRNRRNHPGDLHLPGLLDRRAGRTCGGDRSPSTPGTSRSPCCSASSSTCGGSPGLGVSFRRPRRVETAAERRKSRARCLDERSAQATPRAESARAHRSLRASE